MSDKGSEQSEAMPIECLEYLDSVLNQFAETKEKIAELQFLAENWGKDSLGGINWKKEAYFSKSDVYADINLLNYQLDELMDNNKQKFRDLVRTYLDDFIDFVFLAVRRVELTPDKEVSFMGHRASVPFIMFEDDVELINKFSLIIGENGKFSKRND